MIKPRTLPGFMELLPQDQILFNLMKSVIAEEYEKCGFVPLDTPVMELSEILLAKAGGETEKQIYQFDKGENKLCLRFDLTVPLAKYVSLYQNELTFPFKRYQIGKVYRGERPQKGRFREFYQCDIDIVGREQLSLLNDAEMPSVIYRVFKRLNVGDFCFRVSNRKLLLGLLQDMKLEQLSMEILRIVDKYDKIGEDNCRLTLKDDYKLSEEQIKQILSFIQINGTKEQQLASLRALSCNNETYRKGIEELEAVVKYMRAFGVPDSVIQIDLKIARGLDYYTGTVYETFLKGAEYMGSVSSGGRYENLAEYYGTTNFPGVGMSIGLTRLFYQLKENGLITPNQKSTAKVTVLTIGDTWDYAVSLLSQIRDLGIPSDIYPDDAKFKNKLQSVLNRETPFAIIIGEDEVKNNQFILKDLNKKEQYILSINDLKNILNYIK